MSRIRSIKPDFFLDNELSELGPLAMLLFAGLWTQADREGRLQDRPIRLKHAILPYFDCDIEVLLDSLSPNFITRYEVDGDRFIQIIHFLRHQCPNVKEQASIIPAPCNDHSRISLMEGKGREGKGAGRAREDDAALFFERQMGRLLGGVEPQQLAGLVECYGADSVKESIVSAIGKREPLSYMAKVLQSRKIEAARESHPLAADEINLDDYGVPGEDE